MCIYNSRIYKRNKRWIIIYTLWYYGCVYKCNERLIIICPLWYYGCVYKQNKRKIINCKFWYYFVFVNETRGKLLFPINVIFDVLYTLHCANIDELTLWYRLVQDNDKHDILLTFYVKQLRLKIVLKLYYTCITYIKTSINTW